MPRVKPHFKVHTSVQSHRRMVGVYGDKELLGIWVSIGLRFVDRYGDRTADKVLVTESDLLSLTGKTDVESARKIMRVLVSKSHLSCLKKGRTYEISFPNFAKKQGFGPREEEKNVPPIFVSASASASASEEKTKKKSKSAAPPRASRPQTGPQILSEQEAPTDKWVPLLMGKVSKRAKPPVTELEAELWLKDRWGWIVGEADVRAEQTGAKAWTCAKPTMFSAWSKYLKTGGVMVNGKREYWEKADMALALARTEPKKPQETPANGSGATISPEDDPEVGDTAWMFSPSGHWDSLPYDTPAGPKLVIVREEDPK